MTFSISEAKHLILDAVGGNKEEAKEIWELEFANSKKILRIDVLRLLEELQSVIL
jgi:hypothetical protein